MPGRGGDLRHGKCKDVVHCLACNDKSASLQRGAVDILIGIFPRSLKRQHLADVASSFGDWLP